MNYYLGPYQWIDDTWQPPATTRGSIDLRNLTQMGTPVIQDGLGFFATIDSVAGYDLLGQGDLREIGSTGSMKSMWNSLLGYRPKGDNLVDLLYDHLTMGSDPTGATASKPLLPDNGNLVLRLGGHSIVKATQFRIGHSPETNQVLSVFQNDYREIRDLVIAGDLPADHHRKVLDFWGEQFGIKDPQDIFIPNDLPKESRIPHDTSISENFDGADNAAIGKELTWVEDAGGADWDNFGSHGRKLPKAATMDERSCYVNSALSSADQECSVTHAVQDDVDTTQAGPACRRSNSAVTFYFTQLSLTADDFKIKKSVTGTATVIGSTIAITASIPDDTKLQVSGSSLKSFLNDVEKDSITDTAVTGNLFCGLYALASGTNKVEFDDWAASDFVAPAAGNPSLLMGLL